MNIEQLNTLSLPRLVTLDPVSRPETTIAVLFSGGPAPGGHNVIVGLFDALGGKHRLLGVQGGPQGLLDEAFITITQSDCDEIRNTGGFDFLGSGRTKLSTEEQFARIREVIKRHGIGGIVIIGGDDSQTNACMLSERLSDLSCSVVGVPKTIDGDLQVGSRLPISFGFDTAGKIYSYLVSNLMKDCYSARKYWHIVKIMGRSASHLTLEVGLQAAPHVTLISEALKQKSLREVAGMIVDCIQKRRALSMDYGVIVFPEGLIEALDVSDLSLPVERDDHGNANLSATPTETLLIDMVNDMLEKPAACIPHFLGYEGRCSVPSRFDAIFTYNLGLLAGHYIQQSKTGVMVGLGYDSTGLKAFDIVLKDLLQDEERGGKVMSVIAKTYVDLESESYKTFMSEAEQNVLQTKAKIVLPIQLLGDEASKGPRSLSLVHPSFVF